jgi:lipoprotein-anchoring transpeptidase ErfK/SrfK
MLKKTSSTIGVLIAITTILLLTTTPQATAQDDAGDYLEHIIQPGETLLEIALFYNVSLEALTELNGIADPDAIYWGLRLLIPINQNNEPVGDAAGAPDDTPVADTPETPPAADTPDAPSVYTVQRGDTLLRIALRFNVSMAALVEANRLADADRIYVGQQLIIPGGDGDGGLAAASSGRSAEEAAPPEDPGPAPAPEAPMSSAEVPDPSVVEGKQIIVVLSKQQVYAYENGTLLRQFIVSTGLPGTPTVQGNFEIYLKVLSQRMTGPDYDLPDVPWVMYFYKGYSFHGTYWHNNFGFPMSHGCVNMRTPEAEWLYGWAPVGTPVEVQP